MRARGEGAISREPSWPGAGLLIVGHGASVPPAAGPTVVAHARAIARRRQFAAVEAGLLNGAPTVEDALGRLGAVASIYVVPQFMSAGQAVRTVIPARLGPDPRLRLCAPVGTHPAMAALVARAAAAACRAHGVAAADAVLVVVGHGSPNDVASAEATRACAARVTGFAAADVAFLDEPPYLADMARAPPAPVTVVAGFFADAGPHAAHDVPRLLGMRPGEDALRRQDGHVFLYTGAIGTDAAVAELILQRVAEHDAALGDRGARG